MRATFWRYIFPTLISFMSSAINGVIDAAIVGHLVGPSGLSVINMCMPINYVMILLLSVTFVGASMVISRDIAKGDYESVPIHNCDCHIANTHCHSGADAICQHRRSGVATVSRCGIAAFGRGLYLRAAERICRHQLVWLPVPRREGRQFASTGVVCRDVLLSAQSYA